jgi:tetratricopeptide (TPR) repeat protein
VSGQAELMRRATALHEARKPGEAARLYEQVLEADPQDADALHLLGVARGQTGDAAAAAKLIGKAIDRRADVALYHINLARALSRLGNKTGMVAALQRAIQLGDSEDMARTLLTQHLMPGANYLDVLKKFQGWLRPASYLEIGVETGRSLALAVPPTRAIGIDPAPRIGVGFSAETRVFQLTSDEFFARHDLAREFGRPCVDLAFIDGLHLFEQALRDFINLERYAGPRSVFLVHDCLPLDEASASRDRRAWFWTGDVWKLIPALKRWRPDLAIRTIATRPSGLAMITQLDPRSRVLPDNFAAIVAQFMEMPVPLELAEQREQLARIDNDLAEIEADLRSRGYGAP